ncbi:unnamed protein product [Durusdinium trenchii]
MAAMDQQQKDKKETARSKKGKTVTQYDSTRRQGIDSRNPRVQVKSMIDIVAKEKAVLNPPKVKTSGKTPSAGYKSKEASPPVETPPQDQTELQTPETKRGRSVTTEVHNIGSGSSNRSSSWASNQTVESHFEMVENDTKSVKKSKQRGDRSRKERRQEE